MRGIGAMGRASALSLWLIVQVSPASTLPLPPEACTTLEQERHTLEAAGVLDNLRATPDQAKALAKDKVEHVLRYVETSSLALFRCNLAIKPGVGAGVASAASTSGKIALEKRKLPSKH